jgi:hypothetical protein
MSTKSKGNILETITEILERSLSYKSTVITKNKKLVDLDGLKREIDIYIETIVNKRKFNIAIECKNYNEKYRINMDKIGVFYEKCSRLPLIHKKIFLTTSDYQKGAIGKAKTRNIELYKITKEKIDDRSKKQLGIDNVSTIQKKCKIAGIRFDSEELFKNGIFIDEKLNFYYENGELIQYQIFQNKLLENPDIWKFLFTNLGILLNNKKIIYPNLKTDNVYTKYNNILYPVDSMQFKLEIEYAYKTLEIENVKRYLSLTDDTSLAIFTDLEFIRNGNVYRFCYVKPIDEKNGRIFLSMPDSQKPIELKTLAVLKEGPKPFSIQKTSKIKNVHIKSYEFNMTKDAIKRSLNNQITTEDKNSEFLNKLKSKKTSMLVGIDEQKRKLFFMIPFSHNKKLITAKFPEPISLYFNHSIELFEKSEFYKNSMIANSSKDETILLQDDSYHKYLQYSISSILMLHSAVELFINSCIKDNFKLEIDGKLFNKRDLEEKYTLYDKLIKIVPKISGFKLESNNKIYNSLMELDELNEELQNLRTSDSINQPFLDTFERLLNFRMEKCFDSVKVLFKKINKNYKLIEM